MVTFNLVILANFVSLAFCGTANYVQVSSSSSSLIKPRERIQIPSEFAKNYWVSGNYFNNENFRGLPNAFYFKEEECVNIEEASKMSVDTDCVLLYKGKDCQGPYQVATKNQNKELDGMLSMKKCQPLDDSWKYNNA